MKALRVWLRSLKEPSDIKTRQQIIDDFERYGSNKTRNELKEVIIEYKYADLRGADLRGADLIGIKAIIEKVKIGGVK